MKTNNGMEKDATIPAYISFEMKKGKSSRRKSAPKELSPGRRASLPAAFGTTEEEKMHTSQSRRRSTMPQVTADEKDSLPPLNQLALMLMPPKPKHPVQEK